MTIIVPADHDAGWEYLYFASELARGLVEHRAEYEDYVKGTAHLTGDPVTDPAPQVHALTDELTKAV